MRQIKHIGLLLVLLLGVLSQPVLAESQGQKLFVNLTSDEINRAAMAIGISTKVLEQKKIPVTLFLNVEGVRLADKAIAGHQHANGKTLKQMLADFMAAGGRVIVCPMCMANVGGMTQDDLIPGVEVGGPAVTFPAIFAEGTTVLSY